MNKPVFYIQSELGNQLTCDEFTCYGSAYRAMLEYSKNHPEERVMVGCCFPCDIYQNGKYQEFY